MFDFVRFKQLQSRFYCRYLYSYKGVNTFIVICLKSNDCVGNEFLDDYIDLIIMLTQDTNKQ